MLSCRELEEKFQQHALAVKEQLDCVEQRKVASEQGFKAVNQLLAEIKGLVGTLFWVTDRTSRTRDRQGEVPSRMGQFREETSQ